MSAQSMTAAVGAAVSEHPKSSLAKVLAALDEHGWTYTAEDVPVKIPDPDPSAGYTRPHSRRRTHVPKIEVPGVQVQVVGAGRVRGFTLKFTVEGRYLADQTKGSYPVYQGVSLTTVLDTIEKSAPATVEARAQAQEAERRAREEQEEREVAEAYAAATQAVAEAQAAVAAELVDLGLTEDQVRAVLVLAQAKDGVFSNLAGALFHQDRTGRGWGRGNTSLTGTYENGVRVR